MRSAPQARYIVRRIMVEHAVFWRDSAIPNALFGGGVTIQGDWLRLRGDDGQGRVSESVHGTELVAVHSGDGAASIGDFPSIRLDLQSGRTLVLAAALGTAALAELVNNLLSLIPAG